jgi:beta-lactamase regulating signal transducer with metallopeptidase domain
VLLILFIFRIKDSGIRILFFFLPLIKPFIVIIEKFEPNPDYPGGPTLYSGIRLPDPNNILSWFEDFDISSKLFINNINYLLISITLLLILLVLTLRWLNLFLFYRKLAFEDKVTREEVPRLYSIIDDFSTKISIDPPDISLAHQKYLSPFVAGIKRCTIVLCPNLLEILEHNEKEVLLHHELSHIKGKDNLISWVAMILRDLMFFNPFAYIAYLLIRSEQDSGSDKIMVKYSTRPVKEIARDLLNTVIKLGSSGPAKPAAGPVSAFAFAPNRLFAQYRLKNRIRSVLRNDCRKIRMRIFPRIMMYVLFFIILILQIMLIINIGNYQLYLR